MTKNICNYSFFLRKYREKFHYFYCNKSLLKRYVHADICCILKGIIKKIVLKRFFLNLNSLWQFFLKKKI